MIYRHIVSTVLTLLLFAGGVAGQTAGTNTPFFKPGELEELGFPDTPEGRMKRFGLSEDPGETPDPSKKYVRDGAEYTLGKFEKRWSTFDVKAGWVRPHGNVNFEAEIYRKDDKSIWVWMPVPKPPPPIPAGGVDSSGREFTEEEVKYFLDLRKEFERGPVTPEKSAVTLNFEEASNGLPTSGSWRNSLDLADMNGDGFLDIVAPPQRGGNNGEPNIFLGDGKSNWKFWEESNYSNGVNYGSVAAGDLNGDGKQDLVFGVHLYGVVAFLGDGKGAFTDSSSGLPNDFPTRRVRLADFDRDGDLDIVAISEGPSMFQDKDEQRSNDSRLKIFLNQGKAKSWKLVNVAEAARYVGGDWLVVGNFNGDKYPDLMGSSIYFNGPDTGYLSDGKNKWKAFGRGFVPFQSYYGALTAGRLTSKKVDDAVISYVRIWPDGIDSSRVAHPEIKSFMGLERISWKTGTATRTPVAQWPGEKAIWGMSNADFDGDGNIDIIYANTVPRELIILLGDGKGGFRTPTVRGLETPQNTTYDIEIEDVNGDRKPDVIVMFEAREGVGIRDGSIRVFLNRSGPLKKAPAK